MTAKDTKKMRSFQKALIQRLASPEMDKKLLKDSSGLIAQAYMKGIKWYDVFPLGTPRPNTIEVRGTLPIKDLNKVGDILTNKYSKGLRMFINGMFPPHQIEIHARFGHERV